MAQFVQFHSQWQGRCFVCGEVYVTYDSGHLFCEKCLGKFKNKKQVKTDFFKDVSDELSSFFATILPEVKDIPEDKLRKSYKDLFLEDRLSILKARPKDILKTIFRKELALPC